MSRSVSERRIHFGGTTRVIAFAPDGKHLMSGGQGVQVWRLQDGQQVATLSSGDVRCLVVSNDGKWIAAGTRRGGVHVWSAKAVYVQRFQFGRYVVNTVDFSPDSKQLITASHDHTGTAIVWDVTTWKRIRTLKHDRSVVAAKYSPQGDRIATVIPQNLRIWDSKNGSLLVDVPVQCDYSSCGMVVGLEASTGFSVSAWVVPSNRSSPCALSQHGMFFAYSAEQMVTICDTSTSTALGVIQHNENLVAIVGESGVIVLKHLITVLERELLVESPAPAGEQLLAKWARSMLARSSWTDVLAALVDLVALRFEFYRAICDHLEACNNMTDAVKCFNQMNNDVTVKTSGNNKQMRWAVAFRRRFLEKLPSLGGAAASVQRPDDAIAYYSAALSLNPAFPQDILVKRSQAYMVNGLWEDALDDTNQVIKLDPQSSWNYQSIFREWVRVKLTDGPWEDTLSVASNFKVSRLTAYKTICEHLQMIDRITDATKCLRAMIYELENELESKEGRRIFNDLHSRRHSLCPSERSVLELESRSCKGLEDLGDEAMSAKRYEKAASFYSVALRLDPPSPQALFIKRSQAHAARAMWEDALNDANEVIALDPALLTGHEQKCLALRETGRSQDAIYAFETMLAKMSESPDMDTRDHGNKYRNARPVIRRAIQEAIRDLPPVLIDTASGRLCTRSEQASAFEMSPICMELASTMTTQVDYNYIKQGVANYYRYVMLTHEWEDFEPLFEKIIQIAVYDLDAFPTHHKLQMFCKTAQDAGFHWAWSDTCCINRADHLVLQGALVSMFDWYRGSSLTIVYLRGESSPSERTNLVESIWNSRIWTLQEYYASKVVRFYNEDWTVYRNINVPNHKESPEMMEMETTGISADTLTALQPGFANIRDKLCLASRHETTVQEDATYALFRIFSVSLPIVYGERDHALGQLLALLLASSGDTSILAWTGESGSFNSCLPATLSVFSNPPTTHIPPVTAIDTTEIEVITTELQASRDMAWLMKLYDELLKLPAPLFSGKRMRLPCIAFRLGHVSAALDASGQVFHAKDVLFWTYRRPVEDIEDVDEPALSSLASTALDVEARTLQFLARLIQPFGGLLFASTRRNMEEYRRVAVDCIITVQIQEDAPLDELVANVCTLDVL
ncbi:hypothetical protein JVU11DRAFT_9605 [Chiua virens]|nr:hypothetical protein JVU11DRAFT_9605 [Chiua virens]